MILRETHVRITFDRIAELVILHDGNVDSLQMAAEELGAYTNQLSDCRNDIPVSEASRRQVNICRIQWA